MTATPWPWANPRTTSKPETEPLHLSAMTLRYASFTDRVLAAAAAGFTGIGMGAVDYLDARHAGFSEAQLAEYVERHGLRVVELEFLKDWWREADVRGVRLEEDLLLYLAGVLGVSQINVGLFDDVPHDVVVQGFRRLCARAADHGVRVALEFMPYSRLPGLADARRVIADSGAPNAGLMLDAWHWHRAGGDLAELAQLDAAEVVAVQLSDCQPRPDADLRHEGRHLRRLPGDGVVDLAAFTGTLRTIGLDLPYAVEVLSDDLDAMSPVEVGLLAAKSARAVLSS